MLFKIAFRNLLRNGRRSLMTLLAIAVGGISMVLFGEFVGFVRASLETNAVQNVGHLTVYRKGFFDYGAGNPGALGIADYERVKRLIQEDAVVAPALRIITPTVSLTGIVGNFEIDTSKTFLGTGYVPADRDAMRRWDERGVAQARVLEDSGLREGDESRGVVGVGLARVLGLCGPLHIPNCPPRPDLSSAVASNAGAGPAPDVPEGEVGASPVAPDAPRLDLLAATASGTPNVMSLYVNRAEPQGARELDENFVVMNFALAQKLLYGRGEPKATGLVLQLHRTEDLPRIRARLGSLFAENHLDLEVRDFAEREPFYTQAVGMFGAIFLFISLIMGTIVLFTVVNTMGTSVVERTSEIGTARAMGLRRGGVRRMFVLEGAMLGALGATAGVALGQLAGVAFNGTHAMWTPPGQAAPVPLEVLTSHAAGLLVTIWVALLVAATVAAIIPANRAARLRVVDALRHV
ncbi:MAG TPA: FtsX-like permease family protein [Polyangiaceae bacterium]|jgi:putative ABC transport system permease protein